MFLKLSAPKSLTIRIGLTYNEVTGIFIFNEIKEINPVVLLKQELFHR